MFADMSLPKEGHISENQLSQRNPSQDFECWNLQWNKRETAVSELLRAGRDGSDVAQSYNLEGKQKIWCKSGLDSEDLNSYKFCFSVIYKTSPTKSCISNL